MKGMPSFVSDDGYSIKEGASIVSFHSERTVMAYFFAHEYTPLFEILTPSVESDKRFILSFQRQMFPKSILRQVES